MSRKPQPTAIDELSVLLEDYAGDSQCSCAESALLRWIARRVLDGVGPDDFGLAETARRRMDEIDRRRVPAAEEIT